MHKRRARKMLFLSRHERAHVCHFTVPFFCDFHIGFGRCCKHLAYIAPPRCLLHLAYTEKQF